MLKNKSGFTIIELAVVAGIFLLIITFLAPVVEVVKTRSRRVKCANNLRAISLGLHAYAADHGGTFPSKLGGLYPDYVKEKKAFNCPAVRIAGTPDKPEYEYVEGLTESDPLQEIIARDSDNNHKKAGSNVLKISGSVEWVEHK